MKTVAIAMMATITFAGCANEEPAKVLMDAQEKLMDSKSYEASYEYTLGLDGEKLPAELESAKAILSATKVTGTERAIMDPENFKAEAQTNIDFGVGAADVYFYVEEGRYIVKVESEFLNQMLSAYAPQYAEMLGKNLVVDMEKMMELANASSEEAVVNPLSKEEIAKSRELSKEMLNVVIEELASEFKMENVEEGKEITLKLSNEEFLKAADKIMRRLMAMDTFIEKIKLSTPEYAEKTNEEITEELLAGIDESIAAMKASMEENEAEIEINNFEMKYLIDDEGNIKTVNLTATIAVKSGEEDAEITLNANQTILSINEITSIEAPELTEENTVNLVEYFTAMFATQMIQGNE